jgi:hypothetical protein
VGDFKDFLRGFTGSIARQRNEMALQEREATEWERRQRILSDLNVEERGRMNALEKKDGDTYQKDGQWVTEILDGGGNVTGTRPASPAEIAAVETATLGVDSKRFDVEHQDDAERRAQESHEVDMRYKNESLALQRERISLDRANAAAAAAEASGGGIEGEVDKWLDSDQGKLAAKAYAGTISRAALGNPNLGGHAATAARAGSEDEVAYAARNRMREAIMQHLAAIPPEQRPKNNAELQALITRLAGSAGTSLDKYATPDPARTSY